MWFEVADLPVVAFYIPGPFECPLFDSISGRCRLGDDRPLVCHALGSK